MQDGGGVVELRSHAFLDEADHHPHVTGSLRQLQQPRVVLIHCEFQYLSADAIARQRQLGEHQ